MGKATPAEGKVRAFDHPLLERLSRIHPLVPVLFWGPVAAVLLLLGFSSSIDALAVVGWAAGGLLSWTLIEYLLHRWVFHFEPSHPGLRRRLYPLHRLHHDVQEWDRLVAPPLLSAPLALIFFPLFWLALGWPQVLPFLSGFVVGYLGYDYIHFYTHFGNPKTALGRGLRRRHLQHHFACPDRWYGVSSPIWDYVFRTHVPRGRRPAAMAPPTR